MQTMTTANHNGSNSVLEFARRLIAAALVLTGLYLAVFGNTWAPPVLELLAGSEMGAWLELIVPFLPMAFIGFGAAVFSSRRAKTNSAGAIRNRG
jgi:hypothetical protein